MLKYASYNYAISKSLKFKNFAITYRARARARACVCVCVHSNSKTTRQV